ncbi:MAG TPA: tetratricopeptide repeat protein, partial [Candidatus Udaeobacter sp.]|nr:tetratricopeptide repeat protein [Candidatus Udaeobacter sp.]
LDPSFGIAYENLADVDDDWPGNPDGTDFAKETIGKGWKLFGATGVRLGAHGIIEQMPEDALNERIVGFFYYNGYFVNPDKRLAADWYRKAAEQGNLVAEYEFGLSLEDGDTDIPKGDPRASEEAAKWYRKAAEQSSPDAEVALGNMYRDGNGVDQDAEAAVQWYLKSAEQDDTDGQVSLGDMYLGGQGVGYDPREALNWYSQAADLGNPAAETAIGDFYRNGRGVPRNFSLARKWYLKAAASENADAHYNLGLMSDLGQGTRRNREDALLQYQDAARAYAYDADGGDGHAEARLGTMAATGQGVSQSEVVAYVWYARAYYDLKPGPERDRVLQMMSVLKLKAVAWLAEPRLVNGLIQSAIALQQMVVQPP